MTFSDLGSLKQFTTLNFFTISLGGMLGGSGTVLCTMHDVDICLLDCAVDILLKYVVWWFCFDFQNIQNLFQLNYCAPSKL